MKSDNNRNIIFQKIKSALDNKKQSTERHILPDVDSIYKNYHQSLELTFAEEFNKINGRFVYCKNLKELSKNVQLLFKQEKLSSFFCRNKDIQEILTKIEVPFSSGIEDFNDMRVAVTACEYLIARTGSVMVSSAQESGSKVYAYAPINIIFARKSQLVYDISEATKLLQEKYKLGLPSMISVISGPRIQISNNNSEIKIVEKNKLYVFLVDL